MLGSNFIEGLLPHRPPFLMVESIIRYVGGDAPALNAERSIRCSEPVLPGIIRLALLVAMLPIM